MSNSGPPAARTVLAGTVVALALAACGREELPPPAPVARPVKVLTVGGPSGDRLSFPGTVQASDRAELSFRVSGPLIELPIKHGDEIATGQLLARIDPRDFRIAVAEAKAAFEKSEADHRRFQRLYEKEAVPLADVELRRAQRDVAKARFDQALADLRDTRLNAPFAGWVGRRMVENFESVVAKQVIVTLHNIEVIEIVINVSERLKARAVRGAFPTILAEFDTAPGYEFPLSFKEAAAQADERTQTYAITFSLPQPEEPEGIQVFPGMTATVKASDVDSSSEGGAFTVPSNAVFADERGEPVVWRVDPDTLTVSRRRVEAGELTGSDDIRISGGLQAGEMIAITAVHRLQEGMQIRPMEGRRH